MKNPDYAGAYVFGRYASRRTVDPSGTVHTTMTERPRAEWPVLVKDHHEAYITWADYLASEAKQRHDGSPVRGHHLQRMRLTVGVTATAASRPPASISVLSGSPFRWA